MKRHRKNRKRRGVLLIVVLSILVLFALIGLTYVVVAGQFRSASNAGARAEIVTDEGEELLDRAMVQLMVGAATGDLSPVGSDILGDLYGTWLVGNVSNTPTPPSPVGGDFIRFYASGTWSDKPHYYCGQVLTMTDGPAGLISTRIVEFTPPNTFVVEAFRDELGGVAMPENGNRFIINGRPFSGLEGVAPNESHDAPDAFNPFLAFLPFDANNVQETSGIIGSFIDRAKLSVDILPSGSGGDGIPDLIVDNDRDGLMDGVWVDGGMPIKTAPDGRRYKAYVSYLCLDMDGRVNLNAHGSQFQLQTAYTDTANRQWAGIGFIASGPSNQDVRPRGHGVGPADINMRLVLGNTADYDKVLEERCTSSVTLDRAPGLNGADPMLQLHAPNVPNDYLNLASAPGAYGSPINLLGGGMMGIDWRGQPITHFMGVGEATNPPYEKNLNHPTGHDRLYTAADLERILRFQDVDTDTLSDRLFSLSPSLAVEFAKPEVRRQVTTRSFRIPVPCDPEHIIDRLATRMGTNFSQAEMEKMLPFEVLKGAKMDVNRLWGNGLDSATPNNVIDEPTETGSETVFGSVPHYGGGVTANYCNHTGMANGLARHLYARNLYVMMLLLADDDYRIRLTSESVTDPQRNELTKRRIAQWAVNAVDFRDPDAIMTPFEYDVNPFNGWECDGLVTVDGSGAYIPDGSETRLIWGMEYPDLVLMESAATHDRRTRDTEWDDYADGANEDDHTLDPARGSKRIHTEYAVMPTKKGDKDLDQVRIPEASLFFELHSMANTYQNNPVFPRELYDVDTMAGTAELDLSRLDSSGVHPVWRVAISVPHHNKGDGLTNAGKDPLTLRTSKPDTTSFEPAQMSFIDPSIALPMERYVWFTNLAPSGAASGETTFNTFTNRVADAGLPTGGYMVVGPRAQTYLGAKTTSSDVPDPVVSTNGDQIINLTGGNMAFTDIGGAANYPTNHGASIVEAAEINPPVTLICDMQHTPAGWSAPRTIGMNISEPLPNAANYYDEPTHARHGVTDAYGDGTGPDYKDVPFDSKAGFPLKTSDIVSTGTTQNYKTAFLQRLANPLAAWHPVQNPYITVDWLPLDLTVFNGEDTEPDPWDDGAHGEWDPDEVGKTVPQVVSRERSGTPTNFWEPTSRLGMPTAVKNGEDENLKYDFVHSLGYLNATFHFGQGPMSNPAGVPRITPPWLYWPNRPLASHHELMLVPHSSPSRIGHELKEFVIGDLTVQGNPYDAAKGYFAAFGRRAPFHHLLNFHQTLTSDAAISKPAHHYRLLDYTTVPSRFVGTQTWYSPTNTMGLYKPPFHNLPKFREPGFVNINTMPGAQVWTGISDDGFAVNFTSIDSNEQMGRRGTPDALGRFTNPFRSPWTSGTTSNSKRWLFRAENLNPPPAPQLDFFSMFTRPKVVTEHAGKWERHPYFFYLPMTRTSNMLTTQSNVFAVWITIGYFEVNSAGTPLREWGADTGEVKRHRGFYLIDRSIPVAYERGQRHNIDKAILRRSYIE